MAHAAPVRARIDDFAAPDFSPAAASLRASVAAHAAHVRLEADALLADAATQTGLDDFGDTGVTERLEVILWALRDEGGLSPYGVVHSYNALLQQLKNRLLIQDLLCRHPEIHDVRIERPIFIVGLPRTGTTHLHEVLSADPRLRSVPFWEGLEPVLPESQRPAPGAADPRIGRAAAAVEMMDIVMPYFRRMHAMTPEHPEEDVVLLTIDFTTLQFEWGLILPSWRAYYRAHDQTPHYEYMKTLLKLLQWLRGGTRWVLKAPQHLEQFGPVARVFPDAIFLVTHRDPVPVTASLLTLVTYYARLYVDRPDPFAYGRYWSAFVEDLLSACVRDRHLLPAERSFDVRFHEFMADQFGMLERIYQVADQPLSADSRTALQAFLAAHPRGRHGTVEYDLSNFGIDPAERRAALRFYSERFGVQEET